MPNVVELNGTKKDGKEVDASICLLASWNTELSKPHQEEDGGMLNAIPELVSTHHDYYMKVLYLIFDMPFVYQWL